ncbi:velvet factor-domain-containing protein [Radiomyces spectabilis]|uniref:velvet factor-domain-containing protein n=1 Tax=Radiomyces spectabilis TaxID=64574 RepID=UPI002220B752|nr:velvet factor-domain-containing protein [Radiomyces spectabilis]KAI8365286.1 velvet factor-domain-containing protein [Radiomyces spectabilis]
MSTVIPPPMGLGRPSRRSIQYRLVIRQHPIRARCCGFGEKDRRPLDPPPILQLCVETKDGVLRNIFIICSDADNMTHFIVQCDLYSEDEQSKRNLVYHPGSINYSNSSTAPAADATTVQPSPSSSSPTHPSSFSTIMSFQEPTCTRNLVGTVVSNAYQLVDTNNENGVFFVFPDLSVRTEGQFCLKFIFIDLSAGEPLTMSTMVLDEVFCRPFSVYPAKTFPGMTESTALSRCFAQQGIKIAIRKGTRIKRPNEHSFNVKSPSDGDTTSQVESTATSATVSPDTRERDPQPQPQETVQKKIEKESPAKETTSSTSDTNSSDVADPPFSSGLTAPYRRIHISSFLSSDSSESPAKDTNGQ